MLQQTETTDTQVAIVGGGPVGLGLAIDLAMRGIDVTVLERGAELHSIPKGQNLTQRTGEHFRTWGVTNAIRATTPIPASYGNAGVVTHGSLLSRYSYDWFQRSKVGAYYFATNERLPQYRMEAVLRARAADLPNLTFRTGCKVVGVEQSGDHATVTFEQDGGTEALTAHYVVGCDGARSRVRDGAGITQAMDHQGPRMALLVFRSTALDSLLARFPGKSIYNVINPAMDGYWQFLGRVDLEGGWFYHAPIPDDAEGEAYFRSHLHEMVGAEFDLEFEHIGFWDLRISHAETYRNGRVFIAGDAGHSHPPYGGYGVNTGLEDARNLSWKLAAVLDGWAGEELLDSYTEERHPIFASVSRDFIGRMITDFRGFCAEYDPAKDKAAFEAAWQARTEADDSDVTEFLPNYAGSSIVWGAAGAESGARGTHEFRAAPGYHLAPQDLPGGADLWDLLGPGYVLLDLAGDAGLCAGFTEAAKAKGVPLACHSLNDAGLREAYGTDAILVRPDLFVAWTKGSSGDNDPAAVLARAIGA